MKSKYKITNINHSEKWIYIYDEYTSFCESDGFVDLLKRICNACDGKIINVGEIQFQIIGDKFDLTYQWDDLFGIVVIYSNETQIADIRKYIETFFD